MKKLRFIETYDPVRDTTPWRIEKRSWIFWSYVNGTYESQEKKARALWERCKRLKSTAQVEHVLESI